MTTNPSPLTQLDRGVDRWIAPRHASLTSLSHHLLRISLGVVFLLFGLLKFAPGLSPAEDIAVRAVSDLSFGLVSGSLALILVATMETAIGITLITGRGLKLGLVLLGGALIGILSPLVLFPEALFTGPFFAPSLAGQYVIKDIVLVAAGLVVAVGSFSQSRATRPAQAPNVTTMPPARAADPRPNPRFTPARPTDRAAS